MEPNQTEEIKWAHPIPAKDFKITKQIQDSWRVKGFALVDGLLPNELIDQVGQEIKSYYIGEAGEEAMKRKDFGGLLFPSQYEGFNELTIHPNILATVATLLQTDDIRLTQSDAWSQFQSSQSSSQFDNRDQRVHIDGWNHMLVVPPQWDEPVSVAMIIYLNDVQETGGGTAVIPRQGDDDSTYSIESFLKTPGGSSSIPWVNDKESAEQWLRENQPEIAEFRQKQLYDKEYFSHFHKGTVLLYRHDTWHRGTPLDKEGSCRLVINLSFRRADAEWFQHWNYGWSRSMYTPEQTLQKLVAQSSVFQRTTLGFPKPGDQYWTKQTLKGVTARYIELGFDPKPYEEALKDK